MSQLTKIFQLRGFLHKHRSILLCSPAKLHSHRGGWFPVDVDADIEIFTDGFPHGFQPGNRLSHRSPGIDNVVAVGIHEARFAGRPPFFFSLEPVPYVVCRSSTFSMRIDADLVARFTAQQLPDRLAEGLTQDVPESNLDSADGRHQNRTASVARTTKHRLPKELNICGILSHQVALVLKDGLLNRSL